MAEQIISWLDLGPFEESLGCKFEEFEFSIACQYSKEQVVNPSRSSNCDICCVVELETLKETLICGCGK
jgi:hypothetical protein